MTLKELKERVDKMHAVVYSELRKAAPQKMTLGELVDTKWLLQQMEKTLTDTRKEVNKVIASIDLFGNVGFLQLGENQPDSVRGELATGWPEIQAIPAPPKKDTPEYEEALKSIGIPPEARGLVEFRWQSLQDWLTTRATQGLPFPPGFDPEKQGTRFTLRVRGKKNG